MPKSYTVAVQSLPAAAQEEKLHGAAWLFFLKILILVGFGLGILAGLYSKMVGSVIMDVTMGSALVIGLSQLVGSRRAVDRLIWSVVTLITAAIAVPLVLALLHVHP